MKMWNEFDYTEQMDVLDFIDQFKKKAPAHLREAIAAAVTELNMWANTPCLVIELDEDGREIARAQDPYEES